MDVDIDRFVGIVREVVIQARDHVVRLQQAGVPILRRTDYPILDQFDSGQLRVSFGEGPIDFTSPFKTSASSPLHVSFAELPALNELTALVLGSDELSRRVLLPGMERPEWREHFAGVLAANIPFRILDRLMTIVGADFTNDDFMRAWEPIQLGFTGEHLPVEIVVPVCLATFELDDAVALAENIRVEPIGLGEQAARIPRSIWNGAASECVTAAATHAVVISGYSLAGGGRFGRHGEMEFYPLQLIHDVFDALRIATAVPIGFAQIYMRPVGWAWDYTADLPPIVEGSIGRNYPPHFDNYGWLRPPMRISRHEVDAAVRALAMVSDQSRSIRIASRRFGSASMRTDEDDAVLDVCIALEAALGDSQRSEMTYKLGMRAAALLRQATPPPDDPIRVVRLIKHLYDWRSATVHGTKVEKARNKIADYGNGEEPLDLISGLVRSILQVLADRPSLRDPHEVDRLLIGTANWPLNGR